MARIAGVSVPSDKQLVVGLTSVYGIGISTAKNVCAAAGLPLTVRARDLSEAEVSKLREYVEAHCVTGDELVRRVRQDIKRKVALGSHEGRCHRKNLPVRGQRTKTNSRTSRRVQGPSVRR